MKKKRIIIIGVIVGLILLIGGGLFCYFKVGKKRIEPKEYYGPVSNVAFNYEISSAFENYVLINDGELYGVADSNGKIIIEPSLKNVNNLSVLGSKIKYLILYHDDNETEIVYNLKGEKIYESEYVSYYGEDPITKKEFFETSGYICDENFNKIFNISDVYIYQIVDNIVYYSSNNYADNKNANTIYAYDLETKSKLDITYNDVIRAGNYIYVLGEKSILVNANTKEIKEYKKGYIDPDNEKIVITDGETVFNYDYDGNKYSDKELTITKYKNGLYKDRKGCEYGSKLYDKNGKMISDNCNFYDSSKNYVAEHDWYTGAFIRAYDKSGKVFIEPKSNEVLYASIWNDDNYTYYSETFENDKSITVVYDKDMKKHTPCKNDEGIQGIEKSSGRFVCYSASGRYIADIDGNMLSDKYDDIHCNNNGVCKISDGIKQGLFYNDNFIVDFSDKYDIEIFNDIALVKQLATSNVIKFDKVNSPSKLLKEVKIEDEKVTLDQSIDSIIKEYNLEFEKDEIYANKDFFNKYAYLVLRNGQADYNKYVFDMFRVVVDNKNLLNEQPFLRDLSELNFKLVKELGTAAGTFYDGTNTISLLVSESEPFEVSSVGKSTIYHELMHFVDFSMNTDEESVYNCDGKYYLESEIKDTNSCNKVHLIQSSLLVEAGAEFFSSVYFKNYDIDSYEDGIGVFIVLEYLFGEKEMQKVFFSSNTETELFKLLVLKGGLSTDEFDDFLRYGSNIVYQYVYEGYSEEIDIAYSKIIDVLIKMYENINGTSWKDNYAFRLYLSQLFGNEGFSAGYADHEKLIANSKNKADLEEYLIKIKLFDDEDGDTIFTDIKRELGINTSIEASLQYEIWDIIFRIVNNKPVIVLPYDLYDWDNYGKHIEKGTYIVNYDFENKKIIDYKQIYKEEMKDN